MSDPEANAGSAPAQDDPPRLTKDGRPMPKGLRPSKPGEVRNPKGINGWTKAKERVRDTLAANADDLLATLMELSRKGDVNALKFCLGPAMPQVEQKLEAAVDVTYRWETDTEGGDTGEGQE